ncbi:MAG: rolling circle replication-associated protein [Brevinema sp.]
MACSNPYILPSKGIECPCRKCSLCKKARSRHWYLRCEHEQYYHQDSSFFLTFTYSNENIVPRGTLSDKSKQQLLGMTEKDYKKLKLENKLPEIDLDDNLVKHVGTLLKSDMQKYWKRLRITLKRRGFDFKFKYFMCGEYGGRRGRPHYHAIVFGLPFGSESLIRDLWKNGIVDIKVSVPQTIKYVVGYINKKQVGKKSDLYYLRNGCLNSYQSMSHGIGLQYAIDNSERIKRELSLKDSSGCIHPVPPYYKDKLCLDKDEFERKGFENFSTDLFNCLQMIDTYSYSDQDHSIFENLFYDSHLFNFYYNILGKFFNDVSEAFLRERSMFLDLTKAYRIRRSMLINSNEIQRKKVEAQALKELF